MEPNSESPAAAAFPKPLRIVGYVFFTCGILSLIKLITALFNSNFDINALVLTFCIPAGYFAAIGMSLWRKFMLIVAWIVFVSAGFAIVLLAFVFVLSLFWSAYYPVFPRSLEVGRNLLFLCVSVGLGALFGWVLRVLDDKEARLLAQATPAVPATVSPSQRTALLVSALLAVVISLTGWAFGKVYLHWEAPYDYGTESIATANGEVGIAYGCRFGQLAYVVLQHESKGVMHSAVSSGSSYKGWRVTFPFSRHKNTNILLRLPDGKEVGLPNKTQLYEIVDGKSRSSPERVTLEEFKAFLDSKPERYTIDALLEFAKQRRGGSLVPAAGADNATR